jgi:hypothetical protein
MELGRRVKYQMMRDSGYLFDLFFFKCRRIGVYFFRKCLICKLGLMQATGTASIKIGFDQWKTFPQSVPF